MRIIGGTLRGKKLAELGAGDLAAHLRPTSDRVRESRFNILINGARGNLVSEARVLDLFAGMGALGLEALSRGADHVQFVENGAKSNAILRENITACRAEANTHLHRMDALKLGRATLPPSTLIFLDPPYGKSMGEAALATALSGGWIAPEAILVWEESTPPGLPPEFTLLDQRSYGGTLITLAQRF